MQNLIRSLAVLLSVLSAQQAFSQSFPLTMPPNTFYGRLGISTGPGSAIPIAALTANIWTEVAVVTNKTINCAQNTCTVRLGSDVTGQLGLSNLPSIGADNLLGNPTAGLSIPTGVPLVNCLNALTYNTSTHLFGCNSTAGTGTVTSINIAPGPGLTVSGGPVTTAGSITVSLANRPGPTVSGSNSSTTGTITSSSPNLTLTSAIDFANGQGIRVNHAGTPFAINQPASLAVTAVGTTGATAYAYTIASLDAAGGVGMSLTQISIGNGNATLNATNHNHLAWTAPTGTAPAAIAIYGNKSGSLTLRAVIAGTTTSFDDVGGINFGDPDWLPAVPQTSAALSDWLVTTISSGAGTTTLTLAANAGTSATTQTVIHDDTASLQAALTANLGGELSLPTGCYPITSALTASSRVGIRGVGYVGDSGAGYAGSLYTACVPNSGTVLLPNTVNNGLVFTTDQAIQLNNFEIAYLVQPVPGTTGIIITASDSNANVGSVINDVWVNGADVTGQMINALNFKISNLKSWLSWSQGLVLSSPNYPSFGDSSISQSEFWGQGIPQYTCHICIRTNGGLKISGSKFNFGGVNTDCIHIEPNISTANVEPFIVNGNSFEACNQGINFANDFSGSALVTFVSITGNQIWVGLHPINVNTAGTGQWLLGMAVVGNILATNTGSGLTNTVLDNVSNAVISGNVFACNGCSSSTGLNLATHATNVNVQSNTYEGGFTTKVSNSGSGNVVGGGSM